MIPKPGKEIPALYGGIVIGIISVAPVLDLLNCLCCAGTILGGISAVTFYKNRFTPETPPFTSNDCMVVGGLAGMIGAVISTMLSTIILSMFKDTFLSTLNQYREYVPGSTIDQMAAMLEHGIPTFLVIVALLSNFVIDILFGAIGGLIAYQMYKPKGYPLYPPPGSPPQGPPRI
ncbi:MAG TPA: hypothetical protein VKS81_04285 [Bacteroidota bacterium]|nr:hypothetical protein [Bacteroidota bacterium]